MKPESGRPYERQSVTEAMHLWERAEQADKPIGADKQGNISVVYGSTLDRFNKSGTHRDAAKQCLLDKIKKESGPFLGIRNDVFAQVMKTRLPSIERFANDGNLGNLPTEWQAFQKSQHLPDQLPRDIEIKRDAQAEKMADLLPVGMKIDTRDESISMFTHPFSEASQNRLMLELRLLAHEDLNKTLPLSTQFIKDANRGNTYRIQAPPPSALNDEAAPGYVSAAARQKLVRSPQLTTHGAEVVGKLYDFCEGDLAIMASLSCLLSQSSINKMDDEDAREIAGPGGYRPIFNADATNTSTSTIFELSRDKNGDVIVGLKFLIKASMIASGMPGEEWPFQSGPKSEIATENNFNRRTSIVITLKSSDLRNGFILPRIVKNLETSYVFDFDWKRIDKN